MAPPLLQTRSDGLNQPPTGARSAPLVLHKEVSTPRALECTRTPENMRLVSSLGEVVRGRCGSPNKCEYCAKLGAVENAELLALDALAGNAPQIWACLTTRSSNPDPAAFYRAREKVIRALRRRWPGVEYAALVEFTTGYASRSGGKRRPHWNLLLKGIGPADLEEAGGIILRVWCNQVDALPKSQHVGEVQEFGGLMRYLALHFQKESQAPPRGWRGHRFLKSRGYLETSTPQAREAAKKSLRHKRELWKAIKLGHEGLEAEVVAQAAIVVAESVTWRMAWIEPASGVYRPYIKLGVGLTASGGVTMGMREAL